MDIKGSLSECAVLCSAEENTHSPALCSQHDATVHLHGQAVIVAKGFPISCATAALVLKANGFCHLDELTCLLGNSTHQSWISVLLLLHQFACLIQRQ